jgi:CRISPR/Cas system Type II protein with McrA/HNH and RuvC-like nuclease domain
MPYLLRAAALDKLLDPRELSPAVYHPGQRRGYSEFWGMTAGRF